MARRLRMAARVPVRRGVAAADRAAAHAHPKVDPLVPGRETFRAAVAVRLDALDRAPVGAADRAGIEGGRRSIVRRLVRRRRDVAAGTRAPERSGWPYRARSSDQQSVPGGPPRKRRLRDRGPVIVPLRTLRPRAAGGTARRRLGRARGSPTHRASRPRPSRSRARDRTPAGAARCWPARSGRRRAARPRA